MDSVGGVVGEPMTKRPPTCRNSQVDRVESLRGTDAVFVVWRLTRRSVQVSLWYIKSVQCIHIQIHIYIYILGSDPPECPGNVDVYYAAINHGPFGQYPKASCCQLLRCPEGPSTQYLRTLVPTAIRGMVFGTRNLEKAIDLYLAISMSTSISIPISISSFTRPFQWNPGLS